MKLARACVRCHGVGGNSTTPPFPKLGGQHADYIVRTLEQYQNGERDNALMNNAVAELTDQDRADLAAWYSSQPSDLGTLEID
ncbi:MAG: c-type cytochrome [Gammaproteobacteria bacterium]